MTADQQHEGGFYTSFEVEQDNRPDIDGTDKWMSDGAQTEGRNGLLSTKGGGTRIYSREVTFFLQQSDLPAFSTWLAVCAQGNSFAYYHNAGVIWGANTENYKEYKLLYGEGEDVYSPEMVDPPNRQYHRQLIFMRQYVAPTA